MNACEDFFELVTNAHNYISSCQESFKMENLTDPMKSNVFKTIEGRKHRKFPNLKRNMLLTGENFLHV